MRDRLTLAILRRRNILTAAQVERLPARVRTGERKATFAREFGISREARSDALTKTWPLAVGTTE